MVQPWILTSPASRGIGFEITRRLLTTTDLPVVATARTKLDETEKSILEGLDVDDKRLELVEVDVKDEKSIKDAASFLASKYPTKSSYLHLAFCTPGMLKPEKSPAQIDYEAALETFKLNTLGPMMLLKHFSPFLPSKRMDLTASATGLPPQAVFAIMSARVGSISENRLGGWYSYRASKAAVNQIVKSLNIYLKISTGGKAIAVGLHPGTVKTDLSRDFWQSTPKEKLFEPKYAAERLVDVVKGLREESGGKCWDWKGEEIPP